MQMGRIRTNRWETGGWKTDKSFLVVLGLCFRNEISYQSLKGFMDLLEIAI